MRAYRERSGAVLACVAVFGLLANAGAAAAKGCGGGGCGSAASKVSGKVSPKQPGKTENDASAKPGTTDKTSAGQADSSPAASEEGKQDSATVLNPECGSMASAASPPAKEAEQPARPFRLEISKNDFLPSPRTPALATGATAAQLTPGGHSHPIYDLNLTGKNQIGSKEATEILQATGMLQGRTLSGAISGLRSGYTYGAHSSGALDAGAKQMLFDEYQQMRRAVDKWGKYPTISAGATPALYEGFMRSAAGKVTSLPEPDRYAFIKAVTTQESSRTHWVNGVPVMGRDGDAGFGQILPRTGQSYGRNRYDPQQNLIISATYVNGLIGKYGLREGLARYNGGTTPPAQSYSRYADPILANFRRLRSRV
ncbi:MAG: transglycosylase SLT domain-containing protein [Candidatus Wallbacteria bacterium]|nr:transglycosylase SLT domain-containing protein [Candidatus Wallbacteria bacterium]